MFGNGKLRFERYSILILTLVAAVVNALLFLCVVATPVVMFLVCFFCQRNVLELH